MKVLMENWNNHIAEENINEAFGITGKGLGFDLKGLMTSPAKLEAMADTIVTTVRRAKSLLMNYDRYKPHGNISDEEYEEIIGQAEIDIESADNMLSTSKRGGNQGFFGKPHKLRILTSALEKALKALKALSKFDSEAQALLQWSQEQFYKQQVAKEKAAYVDRLKRHKPREYADYDPGADKRWDDS